MTNFEWYKNKITHMSIEKFAEMLANPDDMFDCCKCVHWHDGHCGGGVGECIEGITQWLNSPHIKQTYIISSPVTAMCERLYCDCGTEMECCDVHMGGTELVEYIYRCPVCGDENRHPYLYPRVISK